VRNPEEIRQAAEVLRDADRIVTTGHVAPDGDALGSALAFAHAARAAGKEAVASFGGDFGIPETYGFLDGSPIVEPGALPDGSGVVLVVFDTGVAARIGEIAEWAETASSVVIVDHHPAPDGEFGDVAFIDVDAAAASQLCYYLIRELDWPINETVATCLLTGIVTDTGRYQYSATDGEVMRIAGELLDAGVRPELIGQQVYESVPFGYLAVSAAVLGRASLDPELQLVSSTVFAADLDSAGIDHEDLDPLIDDLRIVRGAEVAVLLKEVDGGFKVSMRSRGGVDVGAIARAESGGGHHNAAGFTADGDPDETIDRIRAHLRG
jgi:phosphoesterase RecJ-like protein